MTLAPIVLFVYNRPQHTRLCLEYLSKNDLAIDSALYIFADGVKANATAEQQQRVNEVRTVIREQQWCKEVIIREQTQNQGLAKSVIDGVSEIIDKYGKVIVLEDDLLTSKGFLAYMNKALDIYENVEEVKQIAGHTFPLPIPPKNETFFMPLATSWGWAMWGRSWNEIAFTPTNYKILYKNWKLRKAFDINGSYDFSTMLFSQMNNSKKIDSWAVRLWWGIFMKKGLVLYPDNTLVKNIGFDGTGVHCEADSSAEISLWQAEYYIDTYLQQVITDTKKYEMQEKYFNSLTSLRVKVHYNLRCIYDMLVHYLT